MCIRLALAGMAFIVLGVLDLGGLREFVIVAGTVALLGSSIGWLIARRGWTS
ncbi:hypothetical protein [Actinomadura montaniterrae]|uniref:hypothetical protein n=1 Tax=Actinomadura montaniterrae TaxID=1803903 RepID=UPI00178C76A7|nr:hypothetical protein [Actinomadura montaniterrae]